MADSTDAAVGRILTDLLEKARDKLREFSDIQRATHDDAASAEKSAKQASDTVVALQAIKSAIEEIIKQNIPAHLWDGTALRLMNPNGEYGEPVDLRGPKGDRGEQGYRGIEGPRGPQGDRGEKGDKGERGDKGDRGDSFQVDESGPMSGRVAFDNQPKDFSYLATDVGLLFFRLETPGEWSEGLPFGRGEKGDRGERGEIGPPGRDGKDGVTTWDELQEKPYTFPPGEHNHDNRYYTKQQVEKLIADAITAAIAGFATVKNPTFIGDVSVEGNLSATGNIGGFQPKA